MPNPSFNALVPVGSPQGYFPPFLPNLLPTPSDVVVSNIATSAPLGAVACGEPSVTDDDTGLLLDGVKKLLLINFSISDVNLSNG